MAMFFEAIFAPANVWLTALLLLCCMYWALVIVSGLGPDALDIDLDTDTDADADLDADVDAEADADAGSDAGGGHSGGALYAVLRMFNIGDVPLMVVVTVLVLAMWAMSVMLYPVIGDWALLWQLLVLVPVFALSVLVMKVATYPVKRFYRALKEADGAAAIDRLELVGKRCMVTTSQATAAFGQAEYRAEGAPVLLNVRTHENETLTRGQEAVIVGRDDKSGVFIIRAF